MIILIFLLGISLGSFLNVCIYRIPNKESILYPSSHCNNCSTPLRWFNLIPVLSYIFQKGRCGYCRDLISLQYPVVELGNGILAMILYIRFGLSLDYIFYLIVFSVLIIISFIDLKLEIIPNVLNVLILIFSIIYKILNFSLYNISPDFINSLLGFSLSSIIFLGIIIISKGGMGGGDMKLISVLGFILGREMVFLNIFLAFLIASFISIILLIFKVKGRKDSIPFGPFISLAFIITVIWGSSIVNFYILM